MLDGVGRDARTTRAVVTIAAGDEIAFDFIGLSVVQVPHARTGRIEIVQRHGTGVVDGCEARCCACLHQVACDFGLAVDGHFALCEAVQVDAMAFTLEQQLDPVVSQALGMRPGADAGQVEQVHRHLL